MKRWPYSLLILAAACGSASGDPNAKRAEQTKKTAPAARATRVEVATIVASDSRLDLVMPGEVEGSRDSMLASTEGGYVEKVFVVAGQSVRAGQPIAWVNRTIASAMLEQSKVELDRADAELARAKKAGTSLTASRREAATFTAAAAAANYKVMSLRASATTIKAPFAGVVAKTSVEVGEVVPPGGTIARLVSVDPVHVSVTVSDRDVVSLEPGLDVQVSAGARGKNFSGKVARISPAADLKTRAFEVVVEVANAEGLLLPGMISTVRLSRKLDENAIAIPQYVLVTRREGNGVFVAEGGVAKWRPLKLGRVVRGQVLVDEGLASGESVIVTGHRELADGDAILISRKGTCCSEGKVNCQTAEAAK